MILNRMKYRVSTLGNRVRNIIPIHNQPSLVNAFKNVGIQVRYFVDPRYRMFIKWDILDHSPIISINAEQPTSMQNWYLAHALGHLIMNYHWIPLMPNENINVDTTIVDYVRPNKSSHHIQAEIIINEFAVSFLILDDELKAIIKRDDCNYINLINTIAQKFQVPLAMAKLRLNVFLAVDDDKL